MDAQHQSDLARILENRRRRGVRQDTPTAEEREHSLVKPAYSSNNMSYGSSTLAGQSPVPFRVAADSQPPPAVTTTNNSSSPLRNRLEEKQQSPNIRSLQGQQSYYGESQQAPVATTTTTTAVTQSSSAAPEYSSRNLGGFAPPSSSSMVQPPAGAHPINGLPPRGGSASFNNRGNSSYAATGSPGGPAPGTAAAVVDPTATNSILNQQVQLQKQQVAQQKQLEVMQAELKQGLAQVNQSLKTFGGSSTGRGSSNAQSPMMMMGSGGAYYGASSSPAYPPYGQQQQQSSTYGQPSGASPRSGTRTLNNNSQQVRFNQQQQRLSHTRGGDSTMPRSVPVPEEFDELTGAKIVGLRQPRGVNFGILTEREIADYDEAVQKAPREPAPLPANATPFSTSTIDIDSSVTVLRSGEWFLKWNDKGNQVRPRVIWYDTEKKVLSWGKKKGEASLLSGYVRIEEIIHVTTDQMHDVGADNVPKIYYVLLIHIKGGKRVQLATEKREKLDAWFDALNNLAMFYRVRGSVMHSHEPSTE